MDLLADGGYRMSAGKIHLSVATLSDESDVSLWQHIVCPQSHDIPVVARRGYGLHPLQCHLPSRKLKLNMWRKRTEIDLCFLQCGQV